MSPGDTFSLGKIRNFEKFWLAEIRNLISGGNFAFFFSTWALLEADFQPQRMQDKHKDKKYNGHTSAHHKCVRQAVPPPRSQREGMVHHETHWRIEGIEVTTQAEEMIDDDEMLTRCRWDADDEKEMIRWWWDDHNDETTRMMRWPWGWDDQEGEMQDDHEDKMTTRMRWPRTRCIFTLMCYVVRLSWWWD